MNVYLTPCHLSKACTLSLHQDELSKMEDEQALAREQTGNVTLGEPARVPNVSESFKCWAQGKVDSESASFTEMMYFYCKYVGV